MRQVTEQLTVELRGLFLSLQKQLSASLETGRGIIEHPGAKGEAAELDWKNMLSTYLPGRYQVSKAFIVDSFGNSSEEIDVVIHDRHYSPSLFVHGDALYLPAEAVYCVVEVKQELSKQTIEDAGQKAASVRKLKRTSAPITHAGGRFPPVKPFVILAGIVCLESTWSPPLGMPLITHLKAMAPSARVDLGCVLRQGAFEVSYRKKNRLTIERSGPDTALVFFFVRLLHRLQQLGTVPAMDLKNYGKDLLG
jgi:hypothetical protein